MGLGRRRLGTGFPKLTTPLFPCSKSQRTSAPLDRNVGTAAAAVSTKSLRASAWPNYTQPAQSLSSAFAIPKSLQTVPGSLREVRTRPDPTNGKWSKYLQMAGSLL